VTESLLAEHRQGRGDAIQNALNVDVDHLLPLLDTQIVKQRDRPDPGVVYEHIELAEPLTRQRYQGGQVSAPLHVRAGMNGFTPRRRDTGHKCLQAFRPARAEDKLRPAFSEEQRGRLTNPAAGASDCNDLALGC
jgi:hypothetical protein